MNNPLYMIFGLMMLGLTGVAEYQGWTLSRINEQKVLPRTIRDNPGAYRSPYSGYSRYTGGK